MNSYRLPPGNRNQERPRRHLLATAAIAAFLICGPQAIGTAWAQKDDEATAECPTYIAPHQSEDANELTMHGVNCFEDERYDWALTYYRRAYEVAPDSFLLAAIGRSLHELGLYEPALAYYHQFLEQEDPDSATAQRIRQRVATIEDALDDDPAVVELRSSPPGSKAHIVLDNGQWYSLGHTPVDVSLRQGSYRFAFDGPGFRPTETRGRAVAGHQRTVETTLISEDSLFSSTEQSRRRAGLWTMAGSGVVTAAGVTLLVLSAQQTSAAQTLENNFDDPETFDQRRYDHLDQADSYRFAGTITTAVGATGLATGALLYFLTKPSTTSDDDQVARSWSVEPQLGFNQVGLRLTF